VRMLRYEVVHVKADEVKLGLRIVMEANKLGLSLALPLVRDLVELVGGQETRIGLQGDEPASGPWKH
jgi:hypothetical protein